MAKTGEGDILGARANVRVYDGDFSCSVGAYKVEHNAGALCMSVFDRGRPYARQAGVHAETGQRLRRPLLLPVTMIEKLVVLPTN